MLEKLIERGFQVEFLAHAKAILSVDFPEVAQRLRRALYEGGWRKHKFEIQRTIDGVAKESISHEVDHVSRFAAGVVALEIEWNNKDPFFDRDLENYKRLHADGAISIGLIITRGEALQNEMRALVLRFAEEKKISRVADLEALGLTPTRRQLDEYNRRHHGETSFAQAWSAAFVADKYGSSTTHWRKLEDRVRRGVGNPCPLLLIGLPSSLVTFGESDDVVERLIDENTESQEMP